MKTVRLKKEIGMNASANKEFVLASCPMHNKFLYLFGYLTQKYPNLQIDLTIRSQGTLFMPSLYINLPLGLGNFDIRPESIKSDMVTIASYGEDLAPVSQSTGKEKGLKKYTPEEAADFVISKLEEFFSREDYEGLRYDS